MTDNHHDTRLVPQHQRIITSSQWVFDKNRDEPSSSTPIHSSSSCASSLANSGSLDHRTHHVQIKPKSSPTSSVDKEARKKAKELENMKLQMEYNTARQENDKLKNVISKLKQEVDTYTKILDERARLPNKQLQNAPPMSSLLINSNAKRRKKTTSRDNKQQIKQEPVPSQVPKEGGPKQDLDLSINPSLTFPQSGLPNIIPTNKIMTNDVMFGALNSDTNMNISGSSDRPNPMAKRQTKSKKNAKNGGNSADNVSPDDIMLMHTLTDVLSHME
ncbi:hypothetical protein ZYGR_0AD06220 [Zygosaccharomyces rouxii]|uniref:ZYRO0G20394p n=2 Tax=Zygosaccharomyces rouxii TaxID=4956 RepID=C5E1E7_ZYGRC|nr:uncharacterized protein ZYRO0G20394g [Zygosaccharomyces rouxii]KAH9202922.1 hypothetical protein LQ764DRAFT_232987 [Zygosaccharomyces rouxii]GAV51439.1 hypothetical protein ZYGR_0AD06220 [Zygosaccharomyces rouxii]CAR29931.1 ZYRO0G20394p [Zygosaccharomyces rouxii]